MSWHTCSATRTYQLFETKLVGFPSYHKSSPCCIEVKRNTVCIHPSSLEYTVTPITSRKYAVLFSASISPYSLLGITDLNVKAVSSCAWLIGLSEHQTMYTRRYTLQIQFFPNRTLTASIHPVIWPMNIPAPTSWKVGVAEPSVYKCVHVNSRPVISQASCRRLWYGCVYTSSYIT